MVVRKYLECMDEKIKGIKGASSRGAEERKGEEERVGSKKNGREGGA